MTSPVQVCRLARRMAVVVLCAVLAGGALAQERPDEPGGGTAQDAAAGQPAPGAKSKGRYTDALDGKFDCSDYLINHKGFLPVPFLITEPAVGYGAGLAFVWFRESLAQAKAQSHTPDGRMVPPDIAAVAAFKTDNGSVGGGGAYVGHLRDDRIRYFAEVGKAELNLDFYGPRQIPRRFAIDAPLVKTDGLVRLGKSDWFAGVRYLYFGASCRFVGSTPSAIAPRELEESVGQAFLVADFDSRDNTLSPSKGTFAEFTLGFARPAFGSSTSFESQQAKAYTYLPMGESFILGLRGDGQFTGGRVPFYARPYLILRGIPAMRYQGEDTLVGEAELRYNATRRWTLLAFGGLGKAYGGRVAFSEAETAVGGGLGFRYLIARKLGLYAGLDVARGSGTDETAIYFQVGSAWR